jgi:sugar O-acyltransferase (sialic acid O-acetyltransferase NeuD family)
MLRPVTGAVVWGGTGQASVVHRLLLELGIATKCICDRDQSVESPVPGVPIFHGEKDFLVWLSAVDRRKVGFVAAIGGSGGRSRLAVHDYLTGLHVEPISVVHPTSWVDATAMLGSGHQILAMAAVGVQVTLGRQCIVNTNATVDHDCHLGDGVHVMPGATIAGEVEIGDGVVIGSNATILPRRVIGDGALVGAGAVVVHDIRPGETVVGVPARAAAKQSPAVSQDRDPWRA